MTPQRKFHISDPRHGLWSAVKVIVMGLVACAIIWMSVNHFDEGELKQIAGIVVALGAIQYGHRQLKKHAEQNGA